MSQSHEVMFYTDGRHTSVYLYEPPMGHVPSSGVRVRHPVDVV